MALIALPNELILHIMGYLQDSHDVLALKSASCTCQALREAAEVCLYNTAKFTKLSSLYQFLEATRVQPKRKEYLRDLQLLFSNGLRDPHAIPTLPDLASFPNLTSFVSESSECQPRTLKRTQWKLFMEHFMQLFKQASLLNDSAGAPKPLQNLRSLVLHWSGVNHRFWDITPMSPIFLLPQLESLHISCVRIGQEESDEWADEWKAKKLQPFRHQTQLKSLLLCECVISIKALHAILSFPKALQTLVLRERFYHSHELNDRFAVEDSDTLNRAIAQQSGSLEYLTIFRYNQFSPTSETIALSLSNFPVLSHLQLGPYLSARRERSFCYVLAPPIPPVLEYLRLEEYGMNMFKSDRAGEALTELLVGDLLANAEARGLSFTLDVSLQTLSRLLQRANLDGRDEHSVVRKLVERLEKEFQQRQEASIPQLSEASSKRSSSDRISSRLRILTNKPRHLVPPFLHDEGPRRFVVRYDSSHPDRFLSNPYAANPVSPERESSSDDENMNAAFGA
ncbi:hypothetical protein F4781DRAFT_421080 [Annulohypoxylon bovei var. microspora]|nr:hypothetical protein F4781DRAFT_421080 [Annulohypoxylon bovei var. microspora]